tara:strand:+ start:335 stop:484 length:150 start_codon:yes stop_codon:yes gene_type:complete
MFKIMVRITFRRLKKIYGRAFSSDLNINKGRFQSASKNRMTAKYDIHSG